MKRLIAFFVIFLFAFVSFPSVAPALSPTKRALLIGIDSYQQVPDLRGCVNDVELMRALLIGKFDVAPENIEVLTNSRATRQAILATIRSHLIDKTKPGDIVILHYSGHGSRMRDVSGDEIDGWDETIVPHDSRTPGVFDINDDELNGLLQQLSEKTKNITFILDSCHSGTATRGGTTVRVVPDDPRPPPVPTSFALRTRGTLEGATDFRVPGSNYVLISGSRANELSNETRLAGRSHGALTYFLAQALRQSEAGATYRDIMDGVRS